MSLRGIQSGACDTGLMAVIDGRDAIVDGARRRERRGRAVVIAVSVVVATWLAVVVWWTVRFWLMLRDAAPVLDMFEAEAGRQLTSDEWFLHREARAVFCWHEGVDPATNRAGRYINGGMAYGPALVAGGLVTAFTGWVAGVSTLVIEPPLRSRLVGAMVLVALFSVVPLVLHWDDIGALTQITE